jgi:ligand-binding sensor domain-containing protein
VPRSQKQKEKPMKKYAHIYTLVLIFVCCTSAEGQHKTVPAKDKFPPKTKDVTTSHGPNVITRTIKQDSKGNIWLASWEGVFRYDGKSFTNVTGKVSSARFFSVLEDRKGNFWFSSVGSGVYYYDGKTFRNFTTKDGLASNEVTEIYEDKTGNIWFSTLGGASLYDGKSFQNFRMNEVPVHNDVNSIVEDSTGKVWFGTRGHAFVYDGKTFTKVTHLGSHFTNVRSIIRDKKGNIWLGGGSGLWRYDGLTFTNYTPYFVGYVHEDKKGNIWTSSQTLAGSQTDRSWVLSRYDEKTLTHAKPTVTEMNPNGGKMLFGILEANDGIIWFGTLDGAYRYDGNTITDSKGKVLSPTPKPSGFWAPPQ